MKGNFHDQFLGGGGSGDARPFTLPWNGLGERALKTITKGREVVIQGRLAISTYTKEVNGQKVQMTKPVIKLTSFHLCGKKPSSDEETQSDETQPEAPKRKLAAAKG